MSSGPDPSLPASPRGQLSAEDLITLNEEIASMARAGLPLDQGLAHLAREMGRGRLQHVTRQLADDLHAGCTLPEALQRQGGRLPPYYAALLSAGIRSGRMREVLATLTLYARSVADFRSTIGSALLYPVIILLMGLGLLVFAGIAILPGYIDVFNKMRVRLPPLTRLMLFVAENAVAILVVPTVVAIVALVVVRQLLRSSSGGRVLWARWIYALPLAGTLIRSARLAAFADLLGILVDQSIPLPEALRLAAEASSDPLLTEGAQHLEQNLRQGLPLAATLQQRRLVPELVVWIVGFGEKRGTLGMALHQVALTYRRQVEVRAALLRTILPPFLILGLAGILGGLFIFGLMAPMHSIMEGLSGGKL